MMTDDQYRGIEDTARQLGVTPEAIRFWEKVGLIQPARRVAGRRVYAPGDVTILREWHTQQRAARKWRKEEKVSK